MRLTKEEYLEHYFKCARYLRHRPDVRFFQVVERILLKCPHAQIRAKANELYEEFRGKYREETA